jgi:enamine deaminase RidA (YjgF/YER057c/UK114 family)
MGRIGARLEELGIVLPHPAAPVANYVSCVQTGDTLHVGGHGPVGENGVMLGKVGSDLTVEEGREAARLTALQLIATMQQELGDLDRVRRIVKVFGMVNVAPGFNNTPAVIDGCSDVLVDIFGDAGRHTRSAVGMAELPFGIAVEIECIAEVD